MKIAKPTVFCVAAGHRICIAPMFPETAHDVLRLIKIESVLIVCMYLVCVWMCLNVWMFVASALLERIRVKVNE